jgi:hypothetical protein
MRSTLSTEKFESQEERADGGVDIYIELSQESTHWAKVQNPDIVRWCWTLFGWAEHCPIRPNIVRSGISGKDFELWGLTGEMPDIVRSDQTLFGQGFLGRVLNLGAHWRDDRHCLAEGVCFGSVEKDLAWLFSLHPHAPLNSTIFLYSRNIKENFVETPLNSFKDPSFELTQI